MTENGDLIPCFTQTLTFRTDDVGKHKTKKPNHSMERNPRIKILQKLKDRSVRRANPESANSENIEGCRNRAYAYTEDIYEADPACAYIPESLRKK